MPTVKTFNMKRIDDLIKKSDIELQQYITSLKRVSDGWERLAKDSIARLKQSSKDVLVVHGDYPTAKAWEELQSFAESLGINFFVEGKSHFDIMKELIELGINRKSS